MSLLAGYSSNGPVRLDRALLHILHLRLGVYKKMGDSVRLGKPKNVGEVDVGEQGNFASIDYHIVQGVWR